MEELTQENKKEIIVSAPYAFDPLENVLRKGDLIVKKYWPNDEPSQKEIDLVIAAIEEAAEALKQKHF